MLIVVLETCTGELTVAPFAGEQMVTAWLAPEGVHEPPPPPPPLVPPVPERLAVCDPAESETVSVPLRVPVAVGVNVTAMLQFAPGARLDPQLFDCAKSPLVPIAEMLNVELVRFFSVVDCDPLVLPIFTEPKLRLVGESVTLEPPLDPVVI